MMDLAFAIWTIEQGRPDFDFTNFHSLLERFDSAGEIAASVSRFVQNCKDDQLLSDYIDLIASYQWPGVAEEVADAVQKVQTRLGDTAMTKIAISKFLRGREALQQMDSEVMSRVVRVASAGLISRYNDVVNMLMAFDYPSFYGLLDNFEEAEVVMNHFKSLAVDEKWEALAGRTIEELKKEPEIAAARAEKLFEVSILGYEAILTYMTVCDKLEFPVQVYDELKDRLPCSGSCDELVKVVEHERDFLNQQTAETVIPLLMIMSETGEEYHLMLKSSDERTKINLAQAYSIAKANIDEDTGKNYLEEFYSGVKGMLETRPDDLGRWAESICSDFRKQGELGLLRGVVG